MMSVKEQLITLLMVLAATVTTRFLPFIIFSSGRKTPKFIKYIGKVLPGAVFGLLVVYCLKSVNFIASPNGLPELISVSAVVLLHLWKRNTLLSIFSGTAIYMMIANFII